MVMTRFARSLVLIKTRKFVAAICDGLGPDRMEWLTKNNIPFSRLLSEEKIAEYRVAARGYQWASEAISDDDFIKMLPKWLLDIVEKHGDQGALWLNETIVWIRSFFRENERVAR